MNDVVSLEDAAIEFSNTYSLVIAKLITEKLVLIKENTELKDYIVNLERELNLKKPKSESNT